MTLYATDYYGWILEQSKAIERHDYSKLDFVNLQEEIDALGRSEKRCVRSFLKVAFIHLLKSKYQTDKASISWEISINNSLFEAFELFNESKTLRNLIPEIFNKAYSSARVNASKQTGLDLEIFPEECPWTIEEILPNLPKE